MGEEGQRKRQAKRVRFNMRNMEASTSTVENFPPAKSSDRGSREPTREPIPMSVRPKEQHRLRASRHPTCATQSPRYEFQPASGKGQDICLEREYRVVTTRRPITNEIRIQIYCSNVDSIVVGFTSCRLEPTSTTIMARRG